MNWQGMNNPGLVDVTEVWQQMKQGRNCGGQVKNGKKKKQEKRVNHLNRTGSRNDNG